MIPFTHDTKVKHTKEMKSILEINKYKKCFNKLKKLAIFAAATEKWQIT
jgi:hypothetical protein